MNLNFPGGNVPPSSDDEESNQQSNSYPSLTGGTYPPHGGYGSAFSRENPGTPHGTFPGYPTGGMQLPVAAQHMYNPYLAMQFSGK